MRLGRKSIITAGILSTFFVSQLVSADQLFHPPSGFWVGPKTYDGSLKNPTSENANWHFTQWNSPSPVSGFSPNCLANTCKAISVNQRVLFSGGNWEIAQHGGNLECNKEFATFAQANSTAIRNYPGYPSAMNVQSPSLADLDFLNHTIAVKPVYRTIFDRSCKVTQGGDITAVVFKNIVNQHTFFYQIKLTTINFVPKASWWQTGFVGPSWGFGDILATYGETEPELRERKYFRFNLLPRVTELIQSGREGMDSNLSHWVVSGVYHGSHIWGGVSSTAQWDSFSLNY